MLRRNLAVCGRRLVSKIEAEKTDSFLGSGPVTAAGLEEDVRPRSEAEINQFAADNVKLSSGRIMFVNMRPLTTRQNIDDPDSNSRDTRQIPPKTATSTGATSSTCIASSVSAVLFANGCVFMTLSSKQFKSYAQGASSIADTGRPSETADKISAPDVTLKTEFKRVISSTPLTSFVTFMSLKSIPFD